MLSEKLGAWNFWLMFIGVNLTFGPMHILGMQGQPRRMVVWPEKLTGDGMFDLGFWNLIATIGSFTIATGVLLFVINVFRTARKTEKATLDPWDGRTLEWMTDSPPKEHNFDAIPTVHALDEFFHRKYEEVDSDGGTRLVQVKTAEQVYAELNATPDEHMHLPSPSYWPIVLAFALPVIAYGIIFSITLSIVGALILLLAALGWVLEPSVAGPEEFDPPTDPPTTPPADGDGTTKELASVG
jgi:cytochrome c oxidase subunit 1